VRTRLLWFIDSLHVGGAESLMVSFARGYDRERFELVVCCLKRVEGSAIEAQLREAGVEIVALGARNLRDVRAFRRLLTVIRERRIELIHAHLIDASIWAALASRFTGVPAVITLHTAPQPERYRRIRERVMRFAIDRWATLVIVVSDALGRDYLRRGGLRASKLRTAHNGIELGRFTGDRDEARAELGRRYGVPAGATLLVTVSVLREAKGVDVLLRALTTIPAVHLLVVGDGA
jgi:glycosyltransferase involved in cell wall biosynthesis